jgi:hypothetical protein
MDKRPSQAKTGKPRSTTAPSPRPSMTSSPSKLKKSPPSAAAASSEKPKRPQTPVLKSNGSKRINETDAPDQVRSMLLSAVI